MAGARIKRKRLAAGMSLQQLADKLNGGGVHLSKAALSNYETNKTLPNATTLWALAKTFGVSMEYFIHEREMALELEGYRKRAGLSPTRHDQIMALIQDEIEKRIEVEEILGLEILVEIPKQLNIVGSDEAEDIAEKVRSDWGLGDQPISSVTELLEDKGWYVVQTPYDEEFDGLAGIVKPSKRPFAVSRAGISVDRLRLNLLHEAGHAFLKCADAKLTEKAAFRFAAAMLMPKAKVFKEVGNKRATLSMDELLLLKKRYGLSIQAMAFRLRDLGIVSDSYFSLVFTYLNQLGFKIQEPGSKELTFQEVPMAFQAQVLRALAEGLISKQEAERYLPGHDIPAADSALGSSADIKRILSLSREERESVLEVAASAAGDYKNPEVNISGLVDDTKEYP